MHVLFLTSEFSHGLGTKLSFPDLFSMTASEHTPTRDKGISGTQRDRPQLKKSTQMQSQVSLLLQYVP